MIGNADGAENGEHFPSESNPQFQTVDMTTCYTSMMMRRATAKLRWLFRGGHYKEAIEQRTSIRSLMSLFQEEKDRYNACPWWKKLAKFRNVRVEAMFADDVRPLVGAEMLSGLAITLPTHLVVGLTDIIMVGLEAPTLFAKTFALCFGILVVLGLQN